jgi:hypothetical protein
MALALRTSVRTGERLWSLPHGCISPLSHSSLGLGEYWETDVFLGVRTPTEARSGWDPGFHLPKVV